MSIQDQVLELSKKIEKYDNKFLKINNKIDEQFQNQENMQLKHEQLKSQLNTLETNMNLRLGSFDQSLKELTNQMDTKLIKDISTLKQSFKTIKETTINKKTLDEHIIEIQKSLDNTRNTDLSTINQCKQDIDKFNDLIKNMENEFNTIKQVQNTDMKDLKINNQKGNDKLKDLENRMNDCEYKLNMKTSKDMLDQQFKDLMKELDNKVDTLIFEREIRNIKEVQGIGKRTPSMDNQQWNGFANYLQQKEEDKVDKKLKEIDEQIKKIQEQVKECVKEEKDIKDLIESNKNEGGVQIKKLKQEIELLKDSNDNLIVARFNVLEQEQARLNQMLENVMSKHHNDLQMIDQYYAPDQIQPENQQTSAAHNRNDKSENNANLQSESSPRTGNYLQLGPISNSFKLMREQYDVLTNRVKDLERLCYTLRQQLNQILGIKPDVATTISFGNIPDQQPSVLHHNTYVSNIYQNEQGESQHVQNILSNLKKEIESLRTQLLKSLKDSERQVKFKVDISTFSDLERAVKDHINTQQSTVTKVNEDMKKMKQQVRQMDQAIKKLQEQTIELMSIGQANEDQTQTIDEPMFAKRPLQGWTCASCDKDVVNMMGKQAEYTAWSRMPARDPSERISRVGQGFSRMLSSVKPELLEKMRTKSQMNQTFTHMQLDQDSKDEDNRSPERQANSGVKHVFTKSSSDFFKVSAAKSTMQQSRNESQVQMTMADRSQIVYDQQRQVVSPFNVKRSSYDMNASRLQSQSYDQLSPIISNATQANDKDYLQSVDTGTQHINEQQNVNKKVVTQLPRIQKAKTPQKK